MKKKVEVSCSYCGTLVLKDESEVKRNSQKARRNFCSRKCCGKANISNLPVERSNYDISLHCGNKADQYTGLRDHLRRTKIRKQEVDIDLPYLLEVWDKQKGICPYSGIQLTKPLKKNNSKISTASLDRIDSSKGYLKGNIQFVSMVINMMKNTLTHEETIDLCKKIAEFWK